ncbi:MAG TPA: GNAT family acetyltransferase, partial [Tepidisphaeraceae bacterium]|nr:GNAT family acetyltransferase [Tepidisphaeraceae bacterium]
MPEVQIRIFQPSDEPHIVQLWHDCKLTIPANDAHRDIALKRAWQPDLFFVAAIGSHIIGTIMAGYDGHRGWINYLAVASEHRRHGIGTALMERAETELRKLGCPKMNLQVRGTNTSVVAFYKAIG